MMMFFSLYAQVGFEHGLALVSRKSKPNEDPAQHAFLVSAFLFPLCSEVSVHMLACEQQVGSCVLAVGCASASNQYGCHHLQPSLVPYVRQRAVLFSSELLLHICRLSKRGLGVQECRELGSFGMLMPATLVHAALC